MCGKNNTTFNGKLDEEYIPTHKTVKKFVSDFVELKMPNYNVFVRNNLETYAGCMTMDFVTKECHYYVSTVHFLTDNW